MDKTLVRLSAEPTRTRLLITQGARDMGKAMLPPPTSVHPRAMATLLEGLSLFMGERLCVVLCVDDRSCSSASLGLLDALGMGERSVFYEVGIATRLPRRERRKAAEAVRLEGADFRDLRQLGWEWV
jgi:hypothetical protein